MCVCVQVKAVEMETNNYVSMEKSTLYDKDKAELSRTDIFVQKFERYQSLDAGCVEYGPFFSNACNMNVSIE